MDYMKEGSLEKMLPNIAKSYWSIKLMILYSIIEGLYTMHQLNLVHKDFHDGNIFSEGFKDPAIHALEDNVLEKVDTVLEESTSIIPVITFIISDLGLSQPVEYFQSFSEKDKIYGVLPFVAPEVLRSKPYTPASNIYSFSMIMWEFTSEIRPFNDKAHNLHLGLSICKGERPEISENTPQCYIDLMKKCWDEDPNKRPNALEVMEIIGIWYRNVYGNPNDDMGFRKVDKILKQKHLNLSATVNNKLVITKSHSQAYYKSRWLNFTKKLTEELHKTGIQDIGNYNIYQNTINFKINFISNIYIYICFTYRSLR